MNLKKEKDRIEEDKRSELAKVTHDIEKLSTNFSQMLKETLDKMKNRINDANNSWEDAHEQK